MCSAAQTNLGPINLHEFHKTNKNRHSEASSSCSLSPLSQKYTFFYTLPATACALEVESSLLFVTVMLPDRLFPTRGVTEIATPYQGQMLQL